MAAEDHTEVSIKSLRVQVAELRGEQSRQRRYMAFAGRASALAVALPVMTATTWFNRETEDGLLAYTAWHQPKEVDWIGGVAVGLVLLLTILSFVAIAPGLQRRGVQMPVAVVAAFTALLVALLAAKQDDELHTAPGLWLTALAALLLCFTHGPRGDSMRD